MSKNESGSERSTIAGMPRWVKVSLLIFIALVVLFVIMHLAGLGFGPGMHMSGQLAGARL